MRKAFFGRRGVELAAAAIVLLPVLATAGGLFIYGIPLDGRDSTIHAAWYSQFVAELLRGDIYPRWLMGMNDGLGSPVFFFYGPVAYWLTAIFEPFCNDTYGVCQLGKSTALAILASGIFAYLWLRTVAPPLAAAAGAAAYILLPYHSGMSLFTRCSLTEMWGYVWMPVILLGTHRLVREARGGLTLFLAGSSMLNMTHPATALVFFPVPFLYGAVEAAAGRRGHAVLKTGLSAVLGLALAAPYLVPYLLTQKYVAYDNFTSGWGVYYYHFIDTSEYSLYESRISLETAAFAVCALLVAVIVPSHRKDARLWSWTGIGAAALFMMTSLSKPVYEMIPVLQTLQFPWRFNSVLIVAAAAIAAIAIRAMLGGMWVRTALPAVLCAVMLSGYGLHALKRQYWIAYHSEHGAEQPAKQIGEEIRTAYDLPPYRPQWVSPEFWPRKHEDRAAAMGSSALFGANLTPIVAVGPRRAVAHVSGKDDQWVVLRHFYYPMWVAEDARGDAIETRAVEPEGLMAVRVPPETKRVWLSFRSGMPETLGWSIGLGGLVLSFLLGRRWRIRNRRMHADETGVPCVRP